jgi:hypothetical protein
MGEADAGEFIGNPRFDSKPGHPKLIPPKTGRLNAVRIWVAKQGWTIRKDLLNLK